MGISRARRATYDDQQRCERLAEVLARGVLRHMLSRHIPAKESDEKQLEVSAETRLHGVAVNEKRTAGVET